MTQAARLRDTGTTMTEDRQKQLFEAANLLLNARRTHTPIADLPANLQPQSLEEAAFVHGIIIADLGAIGGWKIGAGSPDATPLLRSHAVGLDGTERHAACRATLPLSRAGG
jgi:hypothetical protein